MELEVSLSIRKISALVPNLSQINPIHPSSLWDPLKRNPSRHFHLNYAQKFSLYLIYVYNIVLDRLTL